MSPPSWGVLGNLLKGGSCLCKEELVVVGTKKGKKQLGRGLCLPRNLNHRVRGVQKGEQNWDGDVRKSYSTEHLSTKELNQPKGSRKFFKKIFINCLRISYVVF